MQRRLAAQEQSRRTFVSTASHELRTPLTSLGLMLHGASEELDRMRSRTCPRRATSCGGRSARPSGSASSPRSCSTSAGSTPASSCAPSRSSWSSSRARCSRSSRPASRGPSSSADGPTWVRADPGAVARIARILLNNAHRHGGPTAASWCGSTARAALEVVDAGPGVPPGEEEQIFERFRRGPEAGEDGGFGLGLAIGRELAEQMGGELTLERATAGRGSARPSRRRRGRPAGRLNRRGTVPTRSQHDAHDGPIASRHDRTDARRPVATRLSGPLRPDLRRVGRRAPSR